MNGGWSSSKKRPGLDSGHWPASANQPRARAMRQKSLPRKVGHIFNETLEWSEICQNVRWQEIYGVEIKKITSKFMYNKNSKAVRAPASYPEGCGYESRNFFTSGLFSSFLENWEEKKGV